MTERQLLDCTMTHSRSASLMATKRELAYSRIEPTKLGLFAKEKIALKR